MAGPAQRHAFTFQQIRLIRTMRIVAPQAGHFFQGRVNHGLVELSTLVAAKADITAGSFK